MTPRLRRLWPYAHQHRAAYMFGAGFVIVAVAMRLVVPTLLGAAIDQLREVTERKEPGAAAQLGQVALWIVAAAVVGALVRTGSRLAILGSSRKVVHELRRDLFANLLRLSPSFYVRHRTGHVMSRCVNDVRNVQALTGPVFLYLVETGVLYAVGLTFMLATDPLLTVVGVLPFPFALVFARRIAGRIQRDSRAAQEQLADVSAKLDESLSGMRVVRSLALEEHDAAAFDAEAGAYRKTMLRLARSRAFLQPTMVTLAVLSTVVALMVGGPRVAAGQLSIGELVSFVLYLGILAGPTGRLGFVISSLQRGAAALERVGELLDMEASIPEPAQPRPGIVRDGRIEACDLTIGFAPLAEQPHLSGSLPEDAGDALWKGRCVLDQVSFELPAGRTLGVVGPTGSGKTTLLRALCRQVEVPQGTVFLDGRDVTEIPLADLRSSIGVVPQESFLFSRTLAENVAFGRPDATRDQVDRAVESARLAQDLAQLPLGLETMVGERGVQLSGGQRQRTALARVVLLEPAILLLDDTLSAVDTATADAILEAIEPMMRGRTTVIVAHRVATVRHADLILVLDEGRVVERGDHTELLARGGLYASLWQRQEEGR